MYDYTHRHNMLCTACWRPSPTLATVIYLTCTLHALYGQNVGQNAGQGDEQQPEQQQVPLWGSSQRRSSCGRGSCKEYHSNIGDYGTYCNVWYSKQC